MSPAVTGGGSEPPPIPKDAPPAPRRGLSTTAIVLIVVGVVGLVVVAILMTAAATVVPRMQETARRTTCMNNLSQLAYCYIEAAMRDRRGAQRWSGSALWLAMRKGGRVVRRGQEKALLCPGDPDFAASKARAEGTDWDALDLDHPPRGLCSYAGRDFAAFPIDPADAKKQAIGACIHHDGGALVAFDGGDVQFMTREALGLGPGDPIVVGPESKSPLLRMLVGGN